MSVIVRSKSGLFVKSPAGDLLHLKMVGGVIHIPTKGVMIHGIDSKVYFWLNEPDNDKASAIRDEVSQALAPTPAS